MISLLAVAWLASNQLDIRPLDQIAPPDVTQKLTKTVGQAAAEFDSLSKRLKELKDPTKKEVGESNAEYLDRVNEIFKGRALYIHKMHLVVQENLEAKYRLQAYLDEYKGWAETLAKELQILPGQYQKRADDLKLQMAEKAYDIYVLSSMIKNETKDDTEKKQLFEIASSMVDDKILSTIADKNVRLAKFASLSISEKEAELQKMVNFMKDSDFESDLLSTNIITETKALADVLPKEHLVRIEEMKGALQKSKDYNLEDRAAEISILALYYGRQLNLVEPDNQKDFITILKMDSAALDIEKTLKDFLKLTPGSQNMKLSKDVGLKNILANSILKDKQAEKK
jgi:hypothetical protein